MSDDERLYGSNLVDEDRPDLHQSMKPAQEGRASFPGPMYGGMAPAGLGRPQGDGIGLISERERLGPYHRPGPALNEVAPAPLAARRGQKDDASDDLLPEPGIAYPPWAQKIINKLHVVDAMLTDLHWTEKWQRGQEKNREEDRRRDWIGQQTPLAGMAYPPPFHRGMAIISMPLTAGNGVAPAPPASSSVLERLENLNGQLDSLARYTEERFNDAANRDAELFRRVAAIEQILGITPRL